MKKHLKAPLVWAVTNKLRSIAGKPAILKKGC